MTVATRVCWHMISDTHDAYGDTVPMSPQPLRSKVSPQPPVPLAVATAAPAEALGSGFTHGPGSPRQGSARRCVAYQAKSAARTATTSPACHLCALTAWPIRGAAVWHSSTSMAAHAKWACVLDGTSDTRGPPSPEVPRSHPACIGPVQPSACASFHPQWRASAPRCRCSVTVFRVWPAHPANRALARPTPDGG